MYCNLEYLQEHDSWIALDPYIGCSNNCGYCFLRAHKRTGLKMDYSVLDEEILIHELTLVLKNTPCEIPVSIGNKTDMLFNQMSQEQLLKIVKMISKISPDRNIVTITKSPIDREFAHKFADATNGKGIIFLSQSFASEINREIEKGKIANSIDTYKSFEVIADTEGLTGIHFWRPFLRSWNSIDQIRNRLKLLNDSGCSCSIVIGIKGDFSIMKYYSDLVKESVKYELFNDCNVGDEWLDNNHFKILKRDAKDINYPVFRATSCGISYVSKSVNINGFYYSERENNLCSQSTCSVTQKHICKTDLIYRLENEERQSIISEFLDSLGIIQNEKGNLVPAINEYDYNHLFHLLHGNLHLQNILRKKLWKGELLDGVNIVR